MKTIPALLGALVGLVAGLTISRPPERFYLPPPIHFEVRTCPRPTPSEYRAELLEAALSVGWRCGPMGLWLRESGQ